MNITFNGCDLSQHIKVLDAERSLLPSVENTVTKVTARNGGFFDWDRLDVRVMTVTYVIETEDTVALQKAKRKLAGILKTSEPQKLIFSDEPDVYYMAKLDSDTAVTQTLGVAEGVLTFICIDPLAYSNELTTVSSLPTPDYTVEPVKYKKGELWLVAEDAPPVVLQSDFAGKIAGSEVECPHVIKSGNVASLLPPNDMAYSQTVNSVYRQVEKLDELYAIASPGTTLGMRRPFVISYNILETVKRAYPEWFEGMSLAKQVEKLKRVILKITPAVYAKGSGPTGDKVSFQLASSSGNTWQGSQTNTSASIYRLAYALTDFGKYIQDDGFMHGILYADPSDGITASLVSLDYTNVEITITNPYAGKLVVATKDSDSFDMADWAEYVPEPVIPVISEATADSYPIVTAKFNSECGYVSLINQDGRIVQIGNPDEVDKVAYKKNETVINEPFNSASFSSRWKPNEAVLPYPNYLYDPATPNRQSGKYVLSAAGESVVPEYETAPTGTWGGPAISRAIPVNSEGSAKGNFSSPVRFNLRQGDPRGLNRCELILQSGTEVLAAAILRDSSASKQEYIFEMWVLGEIVDRVALPVKEYPRGFFEMDIVKEYNTLTFSVSEVGGFADGQAVTKKPVVKPITFAGMSDRAVDTVSLWNPKFANRPDLESGWADYKFTWINVDKVAEVPNQFQPDDTLTIDFTEGQIWQNGMINMNLGDIGNDFFPLSHGNNQLFYGYSEWADSPPEIEVTYREAWL